MQQLNRTRTRTMKTGRATVKTEFAKTNCFKTNKVGAIAFSSGSADRVILYCCLRRHTAYSRKLCRIIGATSIGKLSVGCSAVSPPSKLSQLRSVAIEKQSV